MEKNTLSEVIEAEKKIRMRLEAEKEKARLYVDEVKKQTTREVEAAEKRLRESLRQSLRDAEAEAGKKAEALEREAQETAAMLEAFKDDALRQLALRHIAAIVPEAPCDRKDIKS